MNKLSITTQSEDARSLVDAGMAHLHAKRYDDAMTAFEHALTLDPKCADAWNGIGRVNYNIGTPEAAIAAYERAIAIDPHCDHAYYGIGILLSTKLGKYEEAIAAFQRGVAANPNESYLVNAVGSTYARLSRFDEAIAILQQSLAQDPADTYALGWLSMLALRQGKYDEALALSQRENVVAEAHSPHRIIGMIHNHLGDRDLGITHLERAIALEAQDYEARAVLAQIYRAVGRPAEADEQDALADSMAGQDEEYGHACVQALRGNVDEAVALLKVALTKKLVQPGWVRIDPEFAFIADDPRFKALVGE